MKQQQTCKRISLIAFFENNFLGSDLQRIANGNPLPIKSTIDDADIYYYNADLFGLFCLPNSFFDKWEVSVLDYERAYKDGFIKGLEHLKNEEEISLSAYRNKNEKDEVIKQLRNILFEREFVRNHKGLLSVIKTTQLIWTYKNLYEVGYNNGIIYSIDVFSNKVGEQIHKELSNNTKEPEQLKLSDFLHDSTHFDKLEKIKEKFQNSKGKEMASALYFLHKMNILNYEINSHSKGRENLAKLLNPEIKMSGVNKYFITGENKLTYREEDFTHLKEWLSGL